MAVLGLLAWGLWNTRRSLEQTRWEFALHEEEHDAAKIQADVGVIQFLPSRFSITLDEVTQGNGGVTFAGRIGNPFFMTVSALTVEVGAYRPAYELRDAWEENPFELMFPTAIGKAQASVGSIPPGGEGAFRVFIPNVTTVSPGATEFRVTFSGERYGYVR